MVENRIDELRRRLERDPGSRLFAQLAEEHRKAGDHAEAIRVARAGLAVHPGYASARLTLGRALLESGEAGAAAVELAQVVRDAPDNILAGRFLGQALEMSGDGAGALEQYTATLKMAPGDRQLEGQIAALRGKAAPGFGATAVARPASGVPAPPPTRPMGVPPTALAPAGPGVRPVAPPLPPRVSRPAAPGSPGTGVAPAPTIRLPPPAPSAAPVPPPAPISPAAPPAAEPADFAERTLMYVPPPTVNVRVEETLRQPPVAAPPAPPAPPTPPTEPTPAPSADTPIEDTTLPRQPAVGEAGPEATIAVEDTTLPRGRAVDGPTPIEETTLPRRPAPDFSHRAAAAEPTFADEEPFEETLEPGAVSALPAEEPAAPAAVEASAPPAPSPLVAASLPVAAPAPAAPAPETPAPPRPLAMPVAAEAGWSTDTRSFSAIRRADVDGAAETLIAPPDGPLPPSPTAASEPAAPTTPASTSPAPGVDSPLSSSTLAELYLRQGLTERAREVYRQVLADDPGNERAHAGLRDLEAAAARSGPVDERGARRAALQRTIAALESLLGALRRD